MSDIAPVNFSPASTPDPIASGADRVAPRSRPEQRALRPSDRVELSDRARYLDQLSRVPAVRTELIESVRGQIAAGTYQTMDRLEGAIQSLAEELGL
jgi:anti-sigma28 factor (negative regulator of flagellin synthesis)